MKFTKVLAHGAAGGSRHLGQVTLNITASECDTVESVRALAEAAPDMFEVLKYICDLHSGQGDDEVLPYVIDARAAITKAMGAG